MHSSGLTLREYNEIAREVSEMSDKEVNGDIKRWEDESPAIKEDTNGQEETQGNKEESMVDLTIDYTKIPELLKKKRTYKKKVAKE